MQIHLTHPDTEPGGDDGPQQFAVPTRIERRARQLVPTADRLVVDDGLAADLPDQVVGGLMVEPHLHDMPDAETLALHPEQAPCTLQPKPEPHKTRLIIDNLHHSSRRLFIFHFKLLQVFRCLAVAAAHLVEGDISTTRPGAQRGVTIPAPALTLPHLMILFARELVG